MRVLIIGGTGFVGPHAVERIAARGHEVTLFHRGRTIPGRSLPASHVLGDRDEIERFAPAFADLRPDVVLDMFAYTAAEAERIVRLFRGVASRLVVVSSCDVYRAYDRFGGVDPGPPDPVPLTEESPLRERLYPHRDGTATPADRRYHADKIAMERAARSDPEGLPATVLRLPMVYGPGEDPRRVGGYVRRMDDRRPAIPLPESIAGWRSYRAYVADAGEALALCVDRPEAAGRTYHVGEASAAEREWVERIGRAAGWSGEVVEVPDHRMPPGPWRGEHPLQHLSIDSTKIRRELGYREVADPEEAMRATVEWERANRETAIPIDYESEDAALRSG